MYKYMFFTLLLSVMLCANIANLQTLYDQKNYTEVIKESKKLTVSYGDVRLHILWGKSAEALGNVEEAISAYERVLMLTPNNDNVRFKLAVLYAKSDRKFLAKQLAEGSKDYQLTVEEKDRILSLLKSDAGVLSASASVSAGYDSNINVSPDDLELPNSEEEISTRFIRLQAGVNYTYKPEDIENMYIKSGLAFSSQHNEEGYFDLLVGVANAGVGYRSDNFDIYIPLKYSRIHYLNRDLMESIGVHPDFNYVFNASFIGNLNVKYAQRSFIEDADTIMDDSILGIGTGAFWIFGDNIAYLKASYNHYSAKHEEETLFIAKDTLEVSAGITYTLDEDVFLNTSYRYRDTAYDDTLLSNNEKRNDEYHQVDMKLSKVITDDIEGALSYSYVSNISNAPLSEYSKNIVMCNLKYVY